METSVFSGIAASLLRVAQIVTSPKLGLLPAGGDDRFALRRVKGQIWVERTNSAWVRPVICDRRPATFRKATRSRLTNADTRMTVMDEATFILAD
ncbi:hypothetical protein PQR75_14835 [Paraburkholderia fungorum]|uniref:hypothetical protein n=1 Tax=Paraburkholderia fungorum TaxID=134537 RepID=UPI0038B74D88